MQKRVFFGIILGLLALNLAVGMYVFAARWSLAANAPQGAVVQQPTPKPVVGRDVPPPNPLRDGGPAQPILELLPVGMLLLIVVAVVWYRSRKQLAPSTDIEHPSS